MACHINIYKYLFTAYLIVIPYMQQITRLLLIAQVYPTLKTNSELKPRKLVGKGKHWPKTVSSGHPIYTPED